MDEKRLKLYCKDINLLLLTTDSNFLEFSEYFNEVVMTKEGFSEKIHLVVADGSAENINFIKENQTDHEFYSILVADGKNLETIQNSVSFGFYSIIIRPSNRELVLSVLYKIAKVISSNLYNEELHNIVISEIGRNLEKETQKDNLLRNYLNIYPHPIVVVNEKNSITYLNKEAKVKLGVEESEDFDIDHKCVEYEGKLNTIQCLNMGDIENSILAIKTVHGKKIYRVFVNEIEQEDTLDRVYLFNDITIDEYRKFKIKTYNERLEATVLRYKKLLDENSRPVEEVLSVNVSEAESLQEPEKKKEKIEKVVFQERYTQKLTASEYAGDIDEYILTEITELAEIESEIEDRLYELEEGVNQSIITQLADKFLKYSSVISLLFEFNDLSVSVKGVSSFFNNLDIGTLDESQQKKISVVGRSILDDLKQWRDKIFISQDARDIHYL